MAQIAWIGLGNMGGRMSAHLVDAGHTVRGFDVSPAATEVAAAHGVTIVRGVAEAVRDADVVITSLPRGVHVREVYGADDGVWANAPVGALLLDTSTVDIETSRYCHDESATAGFRFVDAPVSGGISGAAAGTLTFMLGGTTENMAAARETVAPMAGNVFEVGNATAGIAAKLVNNMMLSISILAASEGSQLARSLGLDARTFWDIAHVSTADSWALRTWYPVPGIVDAAASNNNFDATFSALLAEKDVALAVSEGLGMGLHLPAAAIALGQLQDLIDEGLGGKDCSLVAKYVSADGSVPGYSPAA